ncbi:RluA family pseudouridine synthase [uncultured Polaribacter sp.]|uniref:RluA family pseudouridine synthase n=1 Tax=uncultured Polaribacter sp. TaxID=174711 RepID=UPI0026300BDB|nr:RluA family pseudouridine synthase [uncultured Polaribacter sp.]
MQILETHTAIKQENPIRFQEYGVAIFKTITTKSALKKAIKKGLIFIDDTIATTSKYIKGGEKIVLIETEKPASFKRPKLKLEVLFEDDFLAIVYKPAGILVSGNKFLTIANALQQNLKKSNQLDAVTPHPVHRLDYATSGALLIGKTSKAIQQLGEIFKKKEITKTYFAITTGKLCIGGAINLSLYGKKASTEFSVLSSLTSKRFTNLNLVKLLPKTGRKHQLRKHMASIGHQILGDKIYGDSNLILNGKGLYLHAFSLDFKHPFTGKHISVSKMVPKKFIKIFPEFLALSNSK